MARGVLTVQTIKMGKGAPSAADLAKTFTTGDATNGHEFTALGREIVTVRNNHASTPYDVTIQSIADNDLGREGDIVVEVPALSEIQVILPNRGFRGTNGKVAIDVEHASILLNVSRPPDTF